MTIAGIFAFAAPWAALLAVIYIIDLERELYHLSRYWL